MAWDFKSKLHTIALQLLQYRKLNSSRQMHNDKPQSLPASKIAKHHQHRKNQIHAHRSKEQENEALQSIERDSFSIHL